MGERLVALGPARRNRRQPQLAVDVLWKVVQHALQSVTPCIHKSASSIAFELHGSCHPHMMHRVNAVPGEPGANAKDSCSRAAATPAYLVLTGSCRHVASSLPHAGHVEAHRQACSCWAICCSLQRCSMTFTLTSTTVSRSSSWPIQHGRVVQGGWTRQGGSVPRPPAP